MTIIRVQLCELDRKEYGVDGELLPEELTVDLEALKDLRAAELVKLDQALGTPLALFIEPLQAWSLEAAQLRHIVALLAVRAAGVDLKLADFDPRLNRAEFTREASDVPPAGTSESSSEVETQSSSSAT